MRIPVFEIPGHEADDIIATDLDEGCWRQGLNPVVVTLDKDLYQLVDTILILNTSKDDLIVDRDKVHELFGVARSRFRICSASGATVRTTFPARPASVKRPRGT